MTDMFITGLHCAVHPLKMVPLAPSGMSTARVVAGLRKEERVGDVDAVKKQS